MPLLSFSVTTAGSSLLLIYLEPNNLLMLLRSLTGSSMPVGELHKRSYESERPIIRNLRLHAVMASWEPRITRSINPAQISPIYT